MEVLRYMHMLFILVVMYMYTPCYAADNGHQLQIRPVSPVRFTGQNLDVTVLTWDTFLEDYTGFEIECIIELYHEPSQLHHHSVVKDLAKFDYTYKNIDESGVVNATVRVYDEDRSLLLLIVFVSTDLVVVQDPPSTTVVDKEDAGKINCLDPGRPNNKLVFEWLKNNATVGNGITWPLKTGEDHVNINYTCMISTVEAEKHYGSVQAAFNGRSATSVRRNVSVVSTDRDCTSGDQCNITVHLESNQLLDMVITDMNGKVLVQGYRTITVTVNSSVVVQLNVTDGPLVLFTKDIKEETSPDKEDESGGLSAGAIAGIIIGCVLAVFIIIVCVYILYKNRQGGYGAPTEQN